MANKRRDADKERFWREVFRRQTASGLSVAAFCRRDGLSQPSFYAWRRTIAERGRRSAHPAKLRPPTVGFVPLRLREDAPRSEAWLNLELGSGLVLRLRESICAQRLAELVQAVVETRR